MTPASKQRAYIEIAQQKKLQQKGMTPRVLQRVEATLKRAVEPKKTVDR